MRNRRAHSYLYDKLTDEVLHNLPDVAEHKAMPLRLEVADTIDRKRNYSGRLISTDKRAVLRKPDRGAGSVANTMEKLAGQIEKLPTGFVEVSISFGGDDPSTFLREQARIVRQAASSVLDNLPKTMLQLMDDTVGDLAEAVRLNCIDPCKTDPRALAKGAFLIVRDATRATPSARAGQRRSNEIVKQWKNWRQLYPVESAEKRT